MLLNIKAGCSCVRVNFYDQQYLALRALLFLFFASSSSSLIPRTVQGLADCNYSQPQVCGNLSIPYPFGMSPECGLPQYRISCKENASYGDGDLAFLQLNSTPTPELQVLAFSTSSLIVNSTHLKAMPSPPNCSGFGNATVELSEEGPFIISQRNSFVVIGCNSNGSATGYTSDNSYPISCAVTGCHNEFDMLAFCNYYDCCVYNLPTGFKGINLTGSGIAYADSPDVCGFATVLSPSTFIATDRGVFGTGHWGINISWALLSSQNCSVVNTSLEYACSNNAECIDGRQIKGYTCKCAQGYSGDGYKAGMGCEDIDECREQPDICEKPPHGICTNTNGSYKCSCTSGKGSGLPGTCAVPDQVTKKWILALGGSLAGFVFLVIVSLLSLVWSLRRAVQRRIKDREDCFKRVGGNQVRSIALFSEKELAEATHNFSDDHVLGEGGFGKVYWGKLSEKHGGNITVAIKRAKSKGGVEEQLAQIESFAREIVLLSKVVHKNVVQLLGCCVGTSVPFLVYEYVERGTLREYIKAPRREVVWQGELVRSGSLLWAWRLHIAVGTAEAICFLHSMSEPIFHLDLTSNNILIDTHYNAKVADFGLACFLTSDATHLTNQLAAGTYGYVDPEYCQSMHVTDKCDVYSLGVILLELISGKLAFSQGPGPLLAHHFRSDVDMRDEIRKHSKQGLSFIDRGLGTDPDVLECVRIVADLARRCVAPKGTHRPSIQEVANILRELQSDRKLDQGPQDLYGVNYSMISDSNEGSGTTSREQATSSSSLS